MPRDEKARGRKSRKNRLVLEQKDRKEKQRNSSSRDQATQVVSTNM